MKRVLAGSIVVVAALIAAYAWRSLAVHAPRAAVVEPAPAVAPSPAPVVLSAPPPPTAAVDAPVDFLSVGGGGTPEYTEVSLEQDIELANRVFPGPALTLFAGGSDSSSVRLLRPQTDSDSLLFQLGELFDPRTARDSQYRRSTLTAQVASLDNFEATLVHALQAGTTPLFLYIASHGLQGERPRDNHVELWGGEPLTVTRLDELEGASPRPLRMVIASCYSGGFAELAFQHADSDLGATHAPRCGLFAGPWDRQTTGCDPNPDRRAQEGYSLHFLHALRGDDREGKPLPRAQLDLDGDGNVSLLEAHTRARIVSHSIDVPTTTSERYLREVEHKRAASPNLKLLPEDAAVIAQLGARLQLPTQAAADKRARELSDQLDALQDDLDDADAALERATGRLTAALLARWPVLSDPYHAEFATTLSQHAPAIQEVLTSSQQGHAYAQARTQAEELAARASALDPDEAIVQRLVRAYETIALATTLAARGGNVLTQYQTLLACERSVP